MAGCVAFEAADHSVTVAAKMMRLELLKPKAELERGLSEFVLGLQRVRAGGALRPRHQHVGPWALGTSVPSAAR